MINIITCCWNAELYIEKCLDSVLKQDFSDYRMFIIDDVSTDETVKRAQNIIDNDSRFKIISNREKKYKLKNFDELLSNSDLIDDSDIIVELDGDDWFYKNSALSIVNRTYENSNILISNSKFIYSNGHYGFSDSVNISNIRRSSFCFSHLRTWKASLWRSVNKQYFIDPRSKDRSYFKITADMAYSLPMLEIAGQNRYYHINDTLLVYNENNPYNDHKEGSASGGRIEQQICDQIIRKLKY